ncbi:hypothetical protein ACMZOO_11365 [Catenovulum sp. SX2]|uniref:hypothetical protein n=1 Tax=Catenovulum sp. SX2 TaxID=3398614 RepID=UPI003F8716C1
MQTAIPERIKSILDLARWAPSPDNLQPWKFRVVNINQFEVHSKDASDWMVYDKNGHVTWLALGFLFETIDIAAAEVGCRVEYQHLPSDDTQTKVFLLTLVEDTSIQPSPLFKQIKSRTVQRQAMGTKPLSAAEKEQIKSALPDEFELDWVEGAGNKFKLGKLLFGCAHTRYIMHDGFKVHSKVIDWRKGFEKLSPTKIPIKSLGVDAVTTALTKWVLSGSWKKFHIIEKYFLGTLWARLMMELRTSMCSNAHFMLRKKQPAKSLEDFILSGRAVMRIWLTTDSLGLGFQPEHTPIMFAEYFRDGIDFTENEKDNRAIKNATKMDAYFKSLYGEKKVEQIIYIARLGRSKPPQARSVRKELQDLML